MGLLKCLKLIVCWTEVLDCKLICPRKLPQWRPDSLGLDHICTTAAQVQAGRRTGDFAGPQSWATCQHLVMLSKTGSSRKQCQVSPGKHQFSVILLLSCAPISSPFLIFVLSLFLFLLPECTSRVPCHGNTCRWRQSSSSTSFASAEEVTNHSTSREVLSPRYPWTICKRGCPWSTRFSQVFSLLLRTLVKALFPLFAPHHVPCLCYFTQSYKLTA